MDWQLDTMLGMLGVDMAYHVGPCFEPDAEDNLDDEANGKVGGEEAIGTNAGVVAVERA